MPRTVDHIVATHQLAQQRREAGQPVWDRKLNLADIFHNDALSFVESRDAIVRRIRISGWLDGRDEFDDLVELVNDHLAYAEDVKEFDELWDAVYDHADADRVWIQTR